MKKAKQYYKFLNLNDGNIVSHHGNQVWEIGKQYSVKGDVEACANGFHASIQPLDAISYVQGDVLAIVEADGDSDNGSDKVCYRSMTIVKAYKWTAEDSVRLAIYAAEQVIKIYEDKYPDDTRPRDAIKAAKAYLRNPTAAAAARADAAARAAAAARADAAARAAAAAARAAAYAAYAAAAAAARADAAAYAAADAAYAAAARADAAYAEFKAKINRWMKARIKKLERLS
ncbi:DUF7666 domain-containing protein [Rhodococcus qingshengii]|uniref:DUF7666 domain-containing protein n=1 Tax=Rhodococcus qingshengii TaxID=334542 RepID=UPI002942BCF6|nr:hypothetical protein [Rhodococcus qingshengii]WOI85966.1 hypothetical protein R0122_22570 [Rhodococcus qingshengii]